METFHGVDNTMSRSGIRDSLWPDDHRDSPCITSTNVYQNKTIYNAIKLLSAVSAAPRQIHIHTPLKSKTIDIRAQKNKKPSNRHKPPNVHRTLHQTLAAKYLIK